MVVNDENLEKYFQHLNKNIAFPCIVTGIEDFRWEEFYILGPGDKDEYEELKKTQPSYTDHYRILSFDDHYDEDNGILANVSSVSDKERTINNLNKLMSFLPSSSLLVDHITRYARSSRLEYNKKPC